MSVGRPSKTEYVDILVKTKLEEDSFIYTRKPRKEAESIVESWKDYDEVEVSIIDSLQLTAN